ncbi:hypothetical protein HOD08_03610 [bacterium]|nr:hypothetical protein [bacterium]
MKQRSGLLWLSLLFAGHLVFCAVSALGGTKKALVQASKEDLNSDPKSWRVIWAQGLMASSVSEGKKFEARVKRSNVFSRFSEDIPWTFVKFPGMRDSGIPKFWHLNFAQKEDAEAVIKSCAEAQEENLILYGHSRGGGSILRSFEIMPDDIKRRIRFIVLDAPLCNSTEIIGCQKFFPRDKRAIKFIKHAWSFLDNRYDPKDTKEPINFVGEIPKDIPVFVISRGRDIFIPQSLQKALVTKMKEADLEVYFFDAEYSTHTKYEKEDINGFLSIFDLVRGKCNIPSPYNCSPKRLCEFEKFYKVS